MKLKFEGTYKSLNSFESEELNDFTVITGKNGSGKSQLVQMFANLNQARSKLQIESNTNISRIQVEGIENISLGSQDHTRWKSDIDNLFESSRRIKTNTKTFLSICLKSGFWFNEIKNHEELIEKIDNDLIKEDDLNNLLRNTIVEYIRNFFQNKANDNYDKIISYLKNKIDKQLKPVIESLIFISEYFNKPIKSIKRYDFYSAPIPEQLTSTPILFDPRIDRSFYNYAKQRDQNRRLYFDKMVDGQVNTSISDAEFLEKYIPPWKLINEILAERKIGFQIQ